MTRSWTKDDYITPDWFLDLVEHVLVDRIHDPYWDNPWYKLRAKWIHGWGDNNFINPPYSNVRPAIEEAISKCTDFRSPANSILLLPANTDSRWFHMLVDAGAVLCFWKGRIKFLKPRSLLVGDLFELVEDPSPRHLPLVAFLGGGPAKERFVRVFSEYGSILNYEG